MSGVPPSISKYTGMAYYKVFPIRRCDCKAQMQVPSEGQCVSMYLSSTAIDYATEHGATMELTIEGPHCNLKYFASIDSRDDNKADVLFANVQSFHFFKLFHSQLLNHVLVHFEIDHKYFWRLHRAIQFTDEVVIEKLLPINKKSFTSRPKSHPKLNFKRGQVSKFHLDTDYQRKALSEMLSCDPRTPYLVLGPFGTGKSHLIAATVVKLLQNSQNRVLVCTHHNVGANTLYRNLQERVPEFSYRALRLVPNQQSLEKVHIHHGGCVGTMDQVDPIGITTWPVIITTFMTALNLRTMELRAGISLDFTHILIDEGAQTREPEALGALSLAKSLTSITIAGDHQQVNMQMCLLIQYSDLS